MRNLWKRIIAILLCTVMIVTLLPQDMFGGTGKASAASLLENSPEYNREILDMLTDIVGSEAEAEEYYNRLQQYGLMDEDGNLLYNWDIEMDGRKITIDEIRDILAGDYDPAKYVWVDGTPVSLDDLKTMIAIEDYIAYIKETYFSDIEMTDEQKANYRDLLNQIKTEGIELVSLASNETHIVGARGISHDARVSVTPVTDPMASTIYYGAAFNMVFNVSLTGAVEGQQVSFKYRALSASRPVTDSGVEKTITLTAGSDGTAETTFTVAAKKVDVMADTDPLYSTESVFYVDCHGITNALFTKKDSSDNDVDCDNLGFEVNCKGSTSFMPNIATFGFEESTGVPDDAYAPVWEDLGFREFTSYIDYLYNSSTGKYEDFYFNRNSKKQGKTVSLGLGQEKMIEWGLVNTVEITHETDLNLTNPLDVLPSNLKQTLMSGQNSPTGRLSDATTTVEVNVGNGKTVNVAAGAIGSLDNASYRDIHAATYQFIINKKYNGETSTLYNYSVGYHPDENYTEWDMTNLVPTGGHKMSDDCVTAQINKGDHISSLTFDGGFAYYILRMSAANNQLQYVNTVQHGTIREATGETNLDSWDLRCAKIKNKTYTNLGSILNGGNPWTPMPFAQFYPGTLEEGTEIPTYWAEGNYQRQPLYAIYAQPYKIKIRFLNSDIDPRVTSISVPAGDYYPGELIPVVVKYSEPVKAGTVIKINGREYTPREDSASNVQTFLIEAVEGGDQNLIVSSLKAVNLDDVADADPDLNPEKKHPVRTTDFFDEAGAGSTYAIKADGVAANAEDKGFTIHREIKRTAFAGMTANLDDSDFTAPRMNVVVDISSDTARTEWLANLDEQFEHVDTDYIAKNLRVRVVSDDGGYDSGYLKLKAVSDNITGGSLTLIEDLALPLGGSGGSRIFVAELYLLNGTAGGADTLTDSMLDPVIGKNAGRQIGIAYAAAGTVVFVEAGDLTLSAKAYKSNGTDPYLNSDGAASPIYLQENPVVKASFTLASGKQYSFGDTSKVTVLDSNGDPVDPDADFIWSSSDPSVAAIDAQGRITPTGTEGSVYFTLTVLNGGLSVQENGQTVSKTFAANTETLVFKGGTTPFFRVPDIRYSITDDQELTVYWSSNICENNGSSTTVFDIKVYRGDYTAPNAGEPSGTPFLSAQAAGTASAPVSKYTFAPGTLHYSYGNADNDYTIFISNTYKGVTTTHKIPVTVESLPATVQLGGLEDYYILDTAGSVTVGWTIRNFARFSSENPANPADLFELLITKNNGVEVARVNNPGTSLGNGAYSGTHTLTNLNFEASADKNGYRETYIVSIKAKNGSESTWSYDSFILYVYDEDALKIWIQPTSSDDRNKRATGTLIDGSGTTDSDSLTMVNSAIANMSQDRILALKRDISLRNVISANYGEYAWTELSDQLEWVSSDNSVATINYRQGTLYEDIRSLSYTTYRPASDFVLSGLKDGQTTITVTHPLTGMTDTLTVTVETLKDKLFLFQCYPQVSTTLTYVNGAGEEKTITSNDKGAAAIYEETGIAGDIYCKSVFNETTYLGTFYNEDLKSGEGDSTKLESYPCNNLSLRRAAYAYVYVKNPDDTPYTDYVMFRGGVYVNGEYLRDVNFSLNDATSAKLPGYVDNFTEAPLGETGKLEVALDQTQMVRMLNHELTAKDEITYSFIISGSTDGTTESTQYYPMYVFIDATASEDQYISSGEGIINFRTNARPNEAHPFIVEQYSTLKNAEGKSLAKTSIRDKRGSIGVSDSYPEAEIETLVMWWGEDYLDEDAYELWLNTSDGYRVADGAGQSEQGITKYPFAKSPLTSYTIHLNGTSLSGSVNSGQKKTLYLGYYRQAGKLSRREDLAFSISNLVGVGKTEESQDLKDAFKNAGKYINTDGSKVSEADTKGDDFVEGTLDFLSSLKFTDSEDLWISLKISPTSDPSKFVGLMRFNFSNMDDIEHQGTGVEIIGQDSSSDFEYIPNVEDLPYTGVSKWMADSQEEMTNYRDNPFVSDTEIGYAVGGYMESLIYWDYNKEKWAMQIVDGGFNVGTGLEFKWNWNVHVGPVPITVSIGVGGQLRVNMDAVTTAYQNNTKSQMELATEYLTTLRLYLYVKVFAGVGIDYSVVALKLGIYGKISLDMTFEWLNRPYLKEHLGENITMLANPDAATLPYNLNGQNFILDGQIGLEFVARCACVSYEKVIYSFNFELMNESTGRYDEIQELWENNQENLREAIDALVSSGAANMINIGGEQYLSLELAARMEDRDYLNDPKNPRVWGSEEKKQAVTLARRVTNEREKLPATLESNTYPYANPKLAYSGKFLAFLSDMDSTDPNATRVKISAKDYDDNANRYAFVTADELYNDQNDTTLTGGSSYGDSHMDLASWGSGSTMDLMVAAWTRRLQDPGVGAGETMSTTDQMVALNGTEVYASVYRPTNISYTSETTRLTSNSSPDMAPSVAVSSDKAIVAWRSVAVSGEEQENTSFNITDFDKKDTIVYRLYDTASGWSNETYTLYNGSSGKVKAIETAMLDDGTAAVVYTLDLDGSDATVNDREIVYAVVDTTGAVTRTVRVTNNAILDENPQITAVKFSNDGDQSFILGWYSQSEDGIQGNTAADIKMLDFDRNGNPAGRLPGSLSQVTGGSEISVTSNFRFAGNADLIDTLSVTWVERQSEHDVLKAVKFYAYGSGNEQIGLTGVIDLAEMPDATLIDSYDVIQISSDYRDSYGLHAAILGTTYGANGETVEKTGEDTNGRTVTYRVPKAVSNLYYVDEDFTNSFSVTSVYFDRETIKRGTTSTMQFGIKNDGVMPITNLYITVGGKETDYYSSKILPGETVLFAADYDVPADRVTDPSYQIEAKFDPTDLSNLIGRQVRFDNIDRYPNNRFKTIYGTLQLDYPDLEITTADIVEEKDGKRAIRIKLNNTLDAALEGSGKKAGISFYSDATMQNEIPGTYFGYNGDLIIDTDTALKMIDEGGFSTQVEFDIARYVQDQKLQQQQQITGQHNISDEIPDSGITVYIAANILTYSNGKYQAEPEPNVRNNTAQVDCDNLKARTGKDVILSTDMEIGNGQTRVTVEMQNTSIVQTTTGNLIVSLLDENGNVIEQKQSYIPAAGNASSNGRPSVTLAANTKGRSVTKADNPSNGLITLGCEGKATKSFTFEHEGASVEVSYSNLILDADNADLASISFSNVPGITLGSFVRDAEGNYAADVEVDNPESTTVMASAKNGDATITVSGSDETAGTPSAGSGNAVSKTVPLTRKAGGSTVTVAVTSKDRTVTKTFILKVSYRTVTVTFDAKGGSTTAPAAVYPGEKVNEPAAPTYSGHTFLGWYKDASYGEKWDFANDTVTSDITLYAKWETKQNSNPTHTPDPGPSYTPTPVPTPELTPEPTPEPAAEKTKFSRKERTVNGIKLDKGVKVKQKSGKLTISWGKVADADIYELYVGYSDDNLDDLEPIVIEAGGKTKKKIGKIGGKKIDASKTVQFKIVAYKLVGEKKVKAGSSHPMYIAGAKNKEYTNVSEVSLPKKSKTLAAGDKYKLDPTLVPEDAGKKLIESNAKKLRYVSADTSVAKVDSKGNITAVGKGTCYVYVISRSGAYTRIKIKVK